MVSGRCLGLPIRPVDLQIALYGACHPSSPELPPGGKSTISGPKCKKPHSGGLVFVYHENQPRCQFIGTISRETIYSARTGQVCQQKIIGYLTSVLKILTASCRRVIQQKFKYRAKQSALMSQVPKDYQTTRKPDSAFHRLMEIDSASWGKSEKMIRYQPATLATESAPK